MAKRRRAAAARRKPPRSIVCGVDLSPASKAAILRAMDLAEALKVRLDVVHVLETPRSTVLASARARALLGRLRREMIAVAEGRLARLLRSLPEGEAAPRPLVLAGDPHEALVRHAARHGAEMIVIGTGGFGFLRRTLVGSTAMRVLRDAPCPVLVVPPGSVRGAASRKKRTGRRAKAGAAARSE